MSKRMSYLVDLNGIVLDEGETPSSWIHAMTRNKYQHPMYGEINFTDERLKRFAESVTKKVRGIDPDIDYDHKKRTDEAAGWVKNAEVRDDGLYLFVEWTADAVQKIKSKAYRYFSPEFLDEWEHPQGGTIQDVLSGGALTNRPFLKDLAPVNLSEMLISEQDPEDEGNDMDPKKFAELLGLPETATEAELLAKTKEFMDKATKPPVQLNDADAELKKLAESNPAIKLLMEQQAKLVEDNVRTKATLRLAEVRGNVFSLNEELRNKKLALPAATVEVLTKVLHETSDSNGKQILDMMKALGETGFVQLGEIGQTKTGTGGGDAIKVFADAVAKAQTELKLNYADAVGHVARQDEDLYRNYVEQSYAVKGD